MHQDKIRTLIEGRIATDGLTETGIAGLKVFRATSSVPCGPAIYEPCVIAIVSGIKEAVLEGTRYVYDNSQYLCCPMPMPVMAGTPNASQDAPLFGVYISLDHRVMNALAVEMMQAGETPVPATGHTKGQGIRLAHWDDAFADALVRVLELGNNHIDQSVLGAARLRELYYAILKGSAGGFARQTFGIGNTIARTIAQLSANLGAPVSIDDMATQAGMSRAVFHRKFKQATTLSPIQYVKSMRLNTAAMLISDGKTVSEAAIAVGYASASQFSREFKRAYGQSPRQWNDVQKSLPLMTHT